MLSNDHDATLLDDNALLDEAFSLFLALAPENMNAEAIEQFNQYFTQYGVIELYDPDEEWEYYVDITVDPAYLAEVIIGLKQHDDQIMDTLFARLLISRETAEKFCHILWQHPADSVNAERI